MLRYFLQFFININSKAQNNGMLQLNTKNAYQKEFLLGKLILNDKEILN